MTETARARNLLYQTLMRVTHRDYAPLVASFREALEQDPDFTARACVHVCTGGSKIRDQQDAAIIALLQASPTFPEYREAGRCLLLGSDVYEIEPGRLASLPSFRIFRIEQHVRQSNRKVPRLVRGAVTDYLRMLEAGPIRFDGVALRNRKALKSAYKHYHIKPSPRAQAILFDNEPPADSKLAILKQIAHSKDPREQAKLVIQHRIPYVVATSVLPKVSPVVGVALISAMSPTEALNSRAWVERSGLLEIAEVKDAYVAKVAKAQASVASAEHRVSAKGTDEVVEAAVTEAKEKAVAKEQRIERRTLIAVDRSGSMDRAIATGLQFLVRIAPLCDDFMVVFFNDYARISEGSWDTLSSAQQSVKGIRASGRTSMRVALETAKKAGFDPEQVVFISDGGENVDSYSSLLGNLLSPPHTIMLRVPGETNVLTPRISRAGYRIDTFETTGEDYYIFDQVTALLGGPPALSLVERILATELPRRSNRKG